MYDEYRVCVCRAARRGGGRGDSRTDIIQLSTNMQERNDRPGGKASFRLALEFY